MRYLVTVTPIYLALSVLIAGAATADDDAAKKEDRNGRRAEMRQKILEEFDADGDGKMNEDERATAREEMRKRRGEQGKGDRAKGERGPKHDGRRGGRGSGRPNPGQLFDKFDANGDGQLSREEFMKLTEEVRANRPRHGRANRKGSRHDGARSPRPPRPDGPPEEGRRRFDRERSLQNSGDRPGPPSRPEGRRRLNEEEGPRRRDQGDRGPRRPGAEGHRPPSPEALFEKFDENGDDQLSRDEFMKLADRMRQLRKRHGRAGGHGGNHGGNHRGDYGGMRDGRGPRRGPPGGDGPPRRPHRPRPESDAGPELPPTDDDSV